MKGGITWPLADTHASIVCVFPLSADVKDHYVFQFERLLSMDNEQC